MTQDPGNGAVSKIPSAIRILVAEEEPEIRSYLDVALRWLGYSADFTGDGEEALARLREQGADYSLLLLDVIMPRKDGLETLREIRTFDTGLPVIMLSSRSSPVTAADAMKSGSSDFLVQPVSHEDLSKAIQKALRLRHVEPESGSAGHPSLSDTSPVVSSSWTKKLDLFLAPVGSSEVPVLLQGETGVGKEVLARQIHACSRRAKKPFLKLNCAALPSELVESELFGYERGAFTGAFRSNPGKFELADGGTLLLDEIGDMDFKLQSKLLQVLQDGEFLRLGSNEICRVDVRVIAATHCDLDQAISDGRFREDLYYRLNVIRIEVPPLRERHDEVLSLAQFFLKKHTPPGEAPVEMSSSLRQTLTAYDWPGNIRELENVIRKLIALRRSDLVVEELKQAASRRRAIAAGSSSRQGPNLRLESRLDAPLLNFEDGARRFSTEKWHSPEHASAQVSATNGEECVDSALDPSILRKVDEARKQAETDAILGALNATLWNRKQAATLLNVDYKALLYKMKKCGIGNKTVRASAL
ncbi:MAG: sigma-54 dependent transcriptional regulator [Acidobacteriia bacterium]|nr:sigma-54 dependent transcriptional regulator [Terriglobia bacterium]